MRQRFAITLGLAIAAMLTLEGYARPVAAEPVARFSSALEIERSAAWVGGLSGLDIAKNGIDFHAATDQGTLVKGTISRKDGALSDISFTDVQPILNRFGIAHAPAFADAEGLAVAEDGRIFISFETEDRVSVYRDFHSAERLAGFTTEWRIFPKNKGLEALALAPDGSLWAFSEFLFGNNSKAHVYHRPNGGEWYLNTTIPADKGLNPVGADFGPDGQLYLLERGFFAVGFFTRVRRLTLAENQVTRIETLLRTVPGRHGNLEGLSVWKDPAGKIRLTMVADDNFRSVQRSEMVEYVLDDGVAPSKQ